MLECRGVIKPLPQSQAQWQVKLAAGSMIPYITDGSSRHWCMSFYQPKPGSSENALPNEGAPNLDLANVNEADSSTDIVPVAPMPGMTTGV